MKVLKPSSVVSKVENFLVGRNRELPSLELSSENLRYFFLTKLLLHSMRPLRLKLPKLLTKP